jgi:hypothetical protein
VRPAWLVLAAWFAVVAHDSTAAKPHIVIILADDQARRRNPAAEQPERSRELQTLLEDIRARGRHAP